MRNEYTVIGNHKLSNNSLNLDINMSIYGLISSSYSSISESNSMSILFLFHSS